MKTFPYGDRALLCELGSAAEVVAVQQRVRAAPPPGIEELIPASRTLLLSFDPEQITAEDLASWVASIDAQPGLPENSAPGSTLLLPVHYDGEDLAAVAEIRGCSIAEVIRWHTDTLWRVAFLGFTPGFGYLIDPAGAGVVVPRHATPRRQVPAGAVALADEFCGVYPRESPGGWQLLGQTEVPLWDLRQHPPASLWPGRAVRFVQAR